jgi:hypothetical protein
MEPKEQRSRWTAEKIGFLVGVFLAVSMVAFLILAESARRKKFDPDILPEILGAGLAWALMLGFIGAVIGKLVGWFIGGKFSAEKVGVLSGAVAAAGLVGFMTMSIFIRGGKIEVGTIVSSFIGAFIAFGLLGGLIGRIVGWLIRVASPAAPAEVIDEEEGYDETSRAPIKPDLSAEAPEVLPADTALPAKSERQYYPGAVDVEEEQDQQNKNKHKEQETE